MECTYVGTEGLQKEFGHDRVRRQAAPLPPPPPRLIDRPSPRCLLSPLLTPCSPSCPSLPTLVPQAYVVLNLTADLRREFTWNTKQLFVFVNAEFETRKNRRNQAVMWSAIIEDKVRCGVRCCGVRREWRSCGECMGAGVMLRMALEAAAAVLLLPVMCVRPPPTPHTPPLAPPARAQANALIQVPALRPQYPSAITDQGFHLRGRAFNVTVAWNVMPTVGALLTRKRTFSGAATGGRAVVWVGWRGVPRMPTALLRIPHCPPLQPRLCHCVPPP